MDGAVPLLPLYAFMAWTETTLLLFERKFCILFSFVQPVACVPLLRRRWHNNLQK